MLRRDQVAINATKHLKHVILFAKLWILALDVSRRQFGDLLVLNSVQNRGVQFLTATESGSNRHPHEHACLILVSFVAKANGHGLSVVSENVSI